MKTHYHFRNVKIVRKVNNWFSWGSVGVKNIRS